MAATTKSPLSREMRRRLAAARAYADLSHTQLGSKIGVSRDTIRRAEAGETGFQPHEAEAFVRRVAEVSALPYEFFTIDFDRLAELVDRQTPATGTDLLAAQVREILRGPDFHAVLLDALEDLGPEVLRRALDQAGGGGAIDPLEQEARGANRRRSAAAADLLDTYAEADAAAAGTPGKADASQEAPPARSAGRRSGA